MFSDQFLLDCLPAYHSKMTAAIAPLSLYIATKSAALLASYRTALDDDERTDLLASLSAYTLAASLLSVVVITEDPALTDPIKTIVRKIERLPNEPETIP